MKKTIRIPKATDPKPVTAKITVSEYNELVEQAEAGNTTISAVVRAAIKQRATGIELHAALDKLRVMQEQFILTMMGEVHNISKDELQTIRQNIRLKVLDQGHEQ